MLFVEDIGQIQDFWKEIFVWDMKQRIHHNYLLKCDEILPLSGNNLHPASYISAINCQMDGEPLFPLPIFAFFKFFAFNSKALEK